MPAQFTSSFVTRVRRRGHQGSGHPAAGGQSERDLREIIGTLRRELLDRVLIVKKHHLGRMLTEYLLPITMPGRTVPSASSPQLKLASARLNRVNLAEHRIRRKQVLGGLTHEYYVAA